MIENAAATHAAVPAQDEQALPATLRSLARRMPTNVLAALVTSGIAGGCAIAVYRPHWWIIGLLAIVLTASGLWGIAQRALCEIRESRECRRPVGVATYWMYLVLRGYALAVAVISGILFLVFAFHVLVASIGVGGG